MATLTIRDIGDDLRTQLRVRAAQHGRSMEAEVREILRQAVTRPEPPTRLGSRIQHRFRAVGGEIEMPSRTDQPRLVDLS